MEKEFIEKAKDDIKVIRQIIDNTSASFVSFGRIFIYWALLYIGISVGAILLNKMTGIFNLFPVLNKLLLPIFILLAFAMFYRENKKTALLGVSKQIMYIWLYIVLLNFLITVIVQVNPELILFTFSIGMLCTYVFTHFRLPLWLFIIYLSVGIAYLFYPFRAFATFYILHGVYPLTFLVFGFYLFYFKSPRRI